MSKNYIADSVPFPENEDRDAFGNWFSGFSDGEGNFTLAYVKSWSRKQQKNLGTPRLYFGIRLRADDKLILQLIHSYLGIGGLFYRVLPQNRSKSHPQWSFIVTRLSEISSVLVPHFEKYPLRSKKSNDFAVWKEAVAFMQSWAKTSSICSRPHIQWSWERLSIFETLRLKLNKCRFFESTEPPAPVKQPFTQKSLFDDGPEI